MPDDYEQALEIYNLSKLYGVMPKKIIEMSLYERHITDLGKLYDKMINRARRAKP